MDRTHGVAKKKEIIEDDVKTDHHDYKKMLNKAADREHDLL